MVQGFEEGKNSVDSATRGKYESIEKKFEDQVTKLRNSRQISFKDSVYTIDKVPNLIGQIGTGLLDVNSAKQVEDIKDQVKKVNAAFVSGVKKAVLDRTRAINELEPTVRSY